MDFGLLFLRIALGVLILGHGTQKAFGWFHGMGLPATAGVFDKWGFRPGRTMVLLAVTTEFVGGILIVVGFATPLAAAMLIGTLIVACAPNLPNGLWATRGGYEVALLYVLMAVTLGFTGSGRYSIDHLIGLPQPDWLGLAVLAFGLVSTIPVLALRRRHLARPASLQTAAAGAPPS